MFPAMGLSCIRSSVGKDFLHSFWLDWRLRPQSTSFEVIRYTVTSITTSLFTFTSVSSRVVKNTELASADNTFYNLGSKVPVSQVTSCPPDFYEIFNITNIHQY